MRFGRQIPDNSNKYTIAKKTPKFCYSQAPRTLSEDFEQSFQESRPEKQHNISDTRYYNNRYREMTYCKFSYAWITQVVYIFERNHISRARKMHSERGKCKLVCCSCDACCKIGLLYLGELCEEKKFRLYELQFTNFTVFFVF